MAEDTQKLQKFLASAGHCSRRQAEVLIEQGRVRVNGRRAHTAQRVTGREKITVDGKAVRLAGTPRRRVLIYNKPAGEVCTRRDEKGRRTVFDGLPGPGRGRWIQVGRLDIQTTGLLLFTNDGDLAARLMHPSSGMEREYVVRVRGEVDDAMCRRLLAGVRLADGVSRFTDIQPAGKGASNQWFYVVLVGGRNREVRRLWESQGVFVSRLKRVRFGNVFLPSGLYQGRYRERDPRLEILSS